MSELMLNTIKDIDLILDFSDLSDKQKINDIKEAIDRFWSSKMLNKEQGAPVSDTTEAPSSNEADTPKSPLLDREFYEAVKFTDDFDIVSDTKEPIYLKKVKLSVAPSDAVEFAEWISERYTHVEKNIWDGDYDMTFNTEELYQLFKETTRG